MFSLYLSYYLSDYLSDLVPDGNIPCSSVSMETLSGPYLEDTNYLLAILFTLVKILFVKGAVAFIRPITNIIGTCISLIIYSILLNLHTPVLLVCLSIITIKNIRIWFNFGEEFSFLLQNCLEGKIKLLSANVFLPTFTERERERVK